MSKDRITPGFYFPQGKFADTYYSKYLSAMNEPSLSNIITPEVEVYRFLWLRTFHPPVAVRVQNSDDGFLLQLKQLDGKGGYEPGNLVANTKKFITAIEWDVFVRHIERASFWTLSSLELENSEEVLRFLSVDGAFWVIEGVKNARHHIVDRCTPPPDKFRSCCLYLLKLSGLEVDPLY